MSAPNYEHRPVAITNVGSILFTKAGSSQATRAKVILRVEEYIEFYMNKLNLSLGSTKALSTSLMTTCVHIVTVVQVQNSIKIGEKILYIIWEKFTPEIQQLYTQTMKQFRIVLAFGASMLYQCIEKLIQPLQIVYLQKLNGEFVQCMDEIQNEAFIRVGCKLYIKPIQSIQTSYFKDPHSLWTQKLKSSTTTSMPKILTLQKLIKQSPIISKKSITHRQRTIFLNTSLENKKTDSVAFSPLTFQSPKPRNCSLVNLCFTPRAPKYSSNQYFHTPIIKQNSLHL
jgi:hypothetical protein